MQSAIRDQIAIRWKSKRPQEVSKARRDGTYNKKLDSFEATANAKLALLRYRGVDHNEALEETLGDFAF